MIKCPYFTVGHIGRTGGDAAKFIFAGVFETGIETDYHICTPWGIEKHAPFTGEEPMRVLGFRRLPLYLMSVRAHHMAYARIPGWTAEELCLFKNGDDELKRMTDNGKHPVDRYLRCEYLRDDICALFTSVYGERFTIRHKAILYSVATKAAIVYDKDPFKFFSFDQLQALYQSNPLWAEAEKLVYGSTWD